MNPEEEALRRTVDILHRHGIPYMITGSVATSYHGRPRTFGRNVAVVSPEDAVLSKLEWARKSGDSERQLGDAAGVIEMNPSVDRDYIDRWARALGVSDLWQQLLG